MKTKAKKERFTTQPPPGAETLMDRHAIMAALRIGVRKFSSMRATGEYPDPDFCLGKLQRWRVGTHNAWVEKQATAKGVTG